MTLLGQVAKTVVTYGAIISACERNGRWQLALDFLVSMESERIS
ncbi:hypothetical protein AK812_SmicGene47584, partial [Symbiodinium microadriaticum]